MTVRLLLLKSGEDIISDVKEMVVGEGDDLKLVGYFLNKPCVVKMTPPSNVPGEFDKTEMENDESKASFRVTLFPWMPLSKDSIIPITKDWVITIVNPTDKLKDMYMNEVINYGENSKDNMSNESDNSNKSD
jgi:hypothetical protein